jgi:hypothetical protein
MSLVQQAQALRDRLANPVHWTGGELAIDDEENTVEYYSPDACRFCLIGGAATVLDPHGQTGIWGVYGNHPLGRLVAAAIRELHPEFAEGLEDGDDPENVAYTFNDELQAGFMVGTSQLGIVERHQILLAVLNRAVSIANEQDLCQEVA